jgi:hypothetical protein
MLKKNQLASIILSINLVWIGSQTQKPHKFQKMFDHLYNFQPHIYLQEDTLNFI